MVEKIIAKENNILKIEIPMLLISIGLLIQKKDYWAEISWNWKKTELF